MPDWLIELRNLFLLGGPLMWPLAACAVLTLCVILDRTLVHYGSRNRFERFLQRVRRRLLLHEAGQLQYQLTGSSKPLPQLTASYLDFLSDRTLRESVLTRERSRHLLRLERRLSWIGVLIPLPILLGLIGGLIVLADGFATAEAGLEPVGGSTWYRTLRAACLPVICGLTIALPNVLAKSVFSRSLLRFERQMQWLIGYLDEWTVELRSAAGSESVPGAETESEPKQEPEKRRDGSRIDLGSESDMELPTGSALSIEPQPDSSTDSDLPIRQMRRRRRS